jgi:hypothetical protein
LAGGQQKRDAVLSHPSLFYLHDTYYVTRRAIGIGYAEGNGLLPVGGVIESERHAPLRLPEVALLVEPDFDGVIVAGINRRLYGIGDTQGRIASELGGKETGIEQLPRSEGYIVRIGRDTVERREIDKVNSVIAQ